MATDRINEEITLSEMVLTPGPPTPEGIFQVILRNESKQQFTLPTGLSVQLLVYSADTGRWQEVKNGTTYLPEDDPIILEPSGTLIFEPDGKLLDDELIFSVWPALDEAVDPSILRVIVVGEDPDGEAVAAYLDIPLGD